MTGVPYDREDSVVRLLKAYGYPEADGYDLSSKNGYTPMVNGSGLDAATAPLYFARSGVVVVDLGALRGVGYNGYLASRTAYPESGSAFVAGWSSVIWVSMNLEGFMGRGVRCAAR